MSSEFGYRKAESTRARRASVEGLEPRIALSASAYESGAASVNRNALTPPTASANGEFYVAGFSASSRWDGDAAAGGTAAYPGAQSLSNWRGALFFASAATPGKLYRLDPGAAAATELKTAAGASIALAKDFVPVGDRLYFGATGGIYVTDGTQSGTRLVHTGTPLAAAGGRLFFRDYSASDSGVLALWVTDPDGQAVTKVRDVEAFAGAELNGKFLFGNQAGLWSSDGTDAGTVVISTDLRARGNIDVRRVGNYVYLVSAITEGRFLHRTDGTAAGTVLLRSDVVLSSVDGSYRAPSVAVVGDTLYYVARVGTDNAQLFATRGTTTTRQVTAFPSPGVAAGLVQVSGQVFFHATSAGSQQLWMTDGAVNNYQQVPGAQGGDAPNYLTAVGGSLYFVHNGHLARYAVRAAALDDDGTLVVSGSDPAETGGDGADTIGVAVSGGNVVATVNGVAASFPASQVLRITVNGMGGADVVTVSPDVYVLQAGTGPRGVTINGGSGADAFAVEGTTADEAINVDANGVRMSGGTPGTRTVAIRGVEDLALRAGDGADQITVAAPSAAAATLTVDAGAGDDAVVIGTGSLQAITGSVTASGGAGRDSLTLDDSANADAVTTLAVLDLPVRLRGDSYALTASALVRTRTAAQTTQTFNYTEFDGGVALRAGTSPNLITVTPDALVPLSVSGGDPASISPTRLGDALSVQTTGVTGSGRVGTGNGSGTYTFANRMRVDYSGIEVPDDLAPPRVAVARFVSSAPPRKLTFRFSEPVVGSAVLAALTLVNRTTGQTVPAAVLPAAFNYVANTATFTFIGASRGLLPQGEYRATIPGAAVRDLAGNVGADVVFDFTVGPTPATGVVSPPSGPQGAGGDLGTGPAPAPPGGPAPAGPVSATPGIAIDGTFGRNGKVWMDLTPGSDISEESAQDATLTHDGKIVTVGTTSVDIHYDVAVVRFLPDGRPDAGFGTAGVVRYHLTNDTRGVAVHASPDGRVLVAGWAKTYVGSIWAPTLVLLRYLEDGTPDPTFGTGGVTTVADGEVHSMTVLSDGAILVGGHIGYQGIAALWRFDADGAPDASFGTNGRVTYDQNGSFQGFGRLTPLPGARFLADTVRGLARFDSGGRLDASFGSGGYAGISGVFGLQDDGRIVVLQNVGTNSSNYAIVARRLTADGQPDPSFGTNGQTTLSFGGSDNFPDDLVIQADGRIVIGATSRGDASYEDFCFARLLPDGAPDPTFGTGGGRFIDSFDNPDAVGVPDNLARLLLLPGGRLLATGSTRLRADEDLGNINARDNLALAQYVLDPPLTIAIGGVDLPVDEGSAFAVSADGTEYAGGAVARYEWDFGYDGRVFHPDVTGKLANWVAGDNGPLTVALRVTTADGLRSIAVATLDVRNVAPTVDPGPSRRTAVAAGISLAVSAADAVPELFTLTLDWGDGTAAQVKNSTVAARNYATTFGHVYAARGVYTVTLTVSDRDGGVSTATTAVRVGNILATVFDDADGDGTVDAGEAPRAGHGVFVDLDQDGVREPDEPFALTDARGEVLFDDLADDAYTVRVDPPPSGTALSLPANATSDVTSWSEAGAAVTFGLTQRAAISGAVYNDANGNGAWDLGELPLGSRTVTAVPAVPVAGQPTSISVQTDGTGRYQFLGLLPGTYFLRSTAPAGWVQVTPSAGQARAITVGVAEVAAGTDFGQTQVAPSEVRGVVFQDVDGDAVRGATEAAASGRVVFLDANRNGLPDPVEATVTVGSDGAYAFRGLPAGAYSIRLVGRGGWEQTAPTAGDGLDVATVAGSISANNNLGTRKVDFAPPGVAAATFRMDAAVPAVAFTFDEPVVGIGNGDLVVKDLTTGATYAFTASYDDANSVATFRPAAGVTLPNGRFEARLAAQAFADQAGNGFAAAYVLNFGVLSGDANMDGTVGFADLVAVAQHYDTVGGATWATGDFDGDGSVGFADLVVVAQNYDKSLPGTPVPAAGPGFQAALAAAFATAAARPAAPAVTRPAPHKPAEVVRPKPAVTPRRPTPVPARKPIAIAAPARSPATTAANVASVPASTVFGTRPIKRPNAVADLLA